MSEAEAQGHDLPSVEETFALLAWDSPYKESNVRWEAGRPVQSPVPGSYALRVTASTSSSPQ